MTPRLIRRSVAPRRPEWGFRTAWIVKTPFIDPSSIDQTGLVKSRADERDARSKLKIGQGDQRPADDADLEVDRRTGIDIALQHPTAWRNSPAASLNAALLMKVKL